MECSDNADSNSFSFVAQHESSKLWKVFKSFDADALGSFEANQARLQLKESTKMHEETMLQSQM
jgi:hypothetical protein